MVVLMLSMILSDKGFSSPSSAAARDAGVHCKRSAESDDAEAQGTHPRASVNSAHFGRRLRSRASASCSIFSPVAD